MTRQPPVAPRSLARRLALSGAAVLAATVIAACSSDLPSSSSSPTSVADTVAASTTTESTLPPTTSTTLAPTTTTEPLVFTPGVVKVANASGINGAAGALTSELQAKGFQVRKATNGFGPYADIPTSVIFVIAGSEDVAKSVSRLMGGIEVKPMTTPAWITDATAGLEDATVLVMLGHDLAGKKLAAMDD